MATSATSSGPKPEADMSAAKGADSAVRLVDDFLELRGGLASREEREWFAIAVGRCVAPERFPSDHLQKELVMIGGDAGAVVMDLACQALGVEKLSVDEALRRKYVSVEAVGPEERKAYTYQWTADSLGEHGTGMWQQMLAKELVELFAPESEPVAAVWDRNGFIYLPIDGELDADAKIAEALEAVGFVSGGCRVRRLLPFVFQSTTPASSSSSCSSPPPPPPPSLATSALTEPERRLLLEAMPAWISRASLQWESLNSLGGGFATARVPASFDQTAVTLCNTS